MEWQQADPKSKEEILMQLEVIKHVLEQLVPLDYDSLKNNQLASMNLMLLSDAAKDCGLHFALNEFSS